MVGQHHAITAREYGVTAVMGTRNATRRILDGAWVMVDGTTGTVEIYAESAPSGLGAAAGRWNRFSWRVCILMRWRHLGQSI